MNNKEELETYVKLKHFCHSNMNDLVTALPREIKEYIYSYYYIPTNDNLSHVSDQYLIKYILFIFTAKTFVFNPTELLLRHVLRYYSKNEERK